MHASKDRLGDLSWAGHEDMGWFEVGPAPEPSKTDIVMAEINRLLKDSEQYVALDNTSMTKGQRIEWSEYRRLLQEAQYQSGFPYEVFWPTRPE